MDDKNMTNWSTPIRIKPKAIGHSVDEFADILANVDEREQETDLETEDMDDTIATFLAWAFVLGREDGVEILPDNVIFTVAAEYRRMKRANDPTLLKLVDHYAVMGDAPRRGGGTVKTVAFFPFRPLSSPPTVVVDSDGCYFQ